MTLPLGRDGYKIPGHLCHPNTKFAMFLVKNTYTAERDVLALFINKTFQRSVLLQYKTIPSMKRFEVGCFLKHLSSLFWTSGDNFKKSCVSLFYSDS